MATSGRPGPVLVDIPKDVQFATSRYTEKSKIPVSHYQPKTKGDQEQISRLVDAIESSKRPIFTLVEGLSIQAQMLANY